MAAENRPGSTLLRVLGLEPRDLSLLGMLGIAAFLLNTAAVLAWSGLMGRFVTRVGGERMPLVYITVNVVSIFLLLGMARGGTRGHSRIWGLLLGASAMLASMGLIPGRRLPPVIFGSFLASWLYLMLVELEFWKWFGQTLPLRQAKRLTPAVGALGTAGRVAGALLATDPLGWGTISALLLLAATCNGLAIPFLLRARALVSGSLEPLQGETSSPPPPPLGEIWAYVRSSPLLIRVAVLTAVIGFFKGTAHYPLTVTARTAFESEEGVAAFFGYLGAGVNLVSVFLQLLGTGQLLRRLRLQTSLSLVPLALAALGLLATIFPVFSLSALIRFTQRAGTRALFVPAAVMLMSPIPAHLFSGARSLAYGIPGSLGFLVAGIGMLCFPGGAPLGLVFASIAGAGLVAVACARGLDQAYLQTLVEAAHASPESAVDMPDRQRQARPSWAGLDELSRLLLASEHPQLVGLVEEALSRGGPGVLGVNLREVLEDLPVETGSLLLEQYCENGWTGEEVDRLAHRVLSSGTQEPVARAIRALEGTGDSRYAEAVRQAMRTVVSEPGKPGAALLAGAVLSLSNRETDLREALGLLRRNLRGDDLPARVAAVHELGRLGLAAFQPDLEFALGDPAPEVVSAAARSLARAHQTTSLPALQERRDREPAGPLREDLDRALRRLNSEAMGEIGALLSNMDRHERKALARSLRALGGRGRMGVLPRVLALPDSEVRLALVEGMREISDRGLTETLADLITQDEESGEVRLTSLDPLLDLCLANSTWEPDHAAFRLVENLDRARDRGEILAFVDRACLALGDLPREEQAERLPRLCRLLEAPREAPDAFRRALTLVLRGDPRTPTALELLEAGPETVAAREAFLAVVLAHAPV